MDQDKHQPATTSSLAQAAVVTPEPQVVTVVPPLLPTASVLLGNILPAPLSNPITPTQLSTPLAKTTANGSGNKRGRKSTFSPQQDLMILREFSARKAHIADHGQKGAKFEEVTTSLVATGVFKVEVEAKSIKDRYNRMQRDFDKSDLKLSKMSGVGGEVTEAEELLSSMREARDDLAKVKDAEKQKVKEKEERKLAAGSRMVHMATKRRAARSDHDSSGEESSSEGDGEEPGDDSTTPKKKKRKRRKHDYGAQISGDLASFGESIHASDDAQITLDKERLALEQERFAFERAERERDRAERKDELEKERQVRKEEREAQKNADLEKFKMMMDMFSQQLDKK